jgi:hypothetical protein
MQLIRTHLLGVWVMSGEVTQSRSNLDCVFVSIPLDTGSGRFPSPFILAELLGST